MPENKRNLFVVCLLLVAFCLTAVVAAKTSLTQTPVAPNHGAPRQTEPQTPATTKLTAATRTREVASAPASSADARAYSAAALQNVALKQNLNWAFGGKQQRGWYLYVPLISQLVGTGEEVGTSGFALALSQWQTRVGLQPSGILDEETLSRMVATWQGRRLKDRAYPRADQLLTAPANDFWDTSRPAELRQVETEAYMAYKRMVRAAAADPTLGLMVSATGELDSSEKFLKIVSSFRSREYQEQLRRQSPNSGRAGLAVNSPHFTGCALDIYVGGEPVDTKDANRALQVQTPVYKWLVRNAERFGFYPYYYEPWHWEYRGTAEVAKR